MKGTCVYCGLNADTREHIPARNLFSDTANVGFITVPSCRRCNYGFQKDEEYFRQLLVSILYEQTPSATYQMNNAVSRSIKRKPALGLKMFSQMSLVDFYSKGGIYLGKKTTIKMKSEDHKRVFNVLDKYVKGLFFYRFKTTIPPDWIIRHHWLTPKFEQKVLSTLKDMRWERIKEDTFVYGVNWVPTTFQSVWCFIFYGQPLFYTFVIDPVTAKRNGK